jgi:N-acetylglutamate synthase-like GNAT family acetyltransferase
MRVAEHSDKQAIIDFLKEANVGYDGVGIVNSKFIILEENNKKILACLGLEELGDNQGILRSLVVSDKLNQGHIVALFQNMQVLCGHEQIHTLYLVANRQSSFEFLHVMGFKKAETIPPAVHLSDHAAAALKAEGAELMKKEMQNCG